MPLFTLPLAASVAGRQSVRFKANLPSRKRKRDSQSPSHDTVPQDSEDDNSLSDVESNLPAASINPLSLTPAEIVQYRLAGLELDEPLPKVKNFPHRGLPTEKPDLSRTRRGRKGKGKARHISDEVTEGSDGNTLGNEEEHVPEIKTREKSGPRLRLQHLMVLTAIVHKCLRENDLPRANRAFAMLLRAEVAGRPIDLRSTGYWSIAAELLIRSQDKPRAAYDSGSEEEDTHTEERRPKGREREYGTQEGRQKAKEFLTQLILQHPYRRQFQRNVSALSLWPVLLTWEIYGIQYQQKESLRIIVAESNIEEAADDSESNGDVEENSNQAESDDSFTVENGRATQRRRRRQEKNWSRKDEVRRTTLAASEQLAARVDEVMSNPPYSENPTMLEIRANLALYIGDLSVPENPVEDGDLVDEDTEERARRSRHLGNKSIGSERRLKFRQRMNDYEKGKRIKEIELDRVRGIIPKIAKGWGNVDGFKNLDLNQDDDQVFHDAQG